MKTVSRDGVTFVVEQNQYLVPDLTVKDVLSAIPYVCLFDTSSNAFSSSIQCTLLQEVSVALLHLCVSNPNRFPSCHPTFIL